MVAAITISAIWSDDAPSSFLKVAEGMDRQEVEDLLGGPAHKVGPNRWDSSRRQWETWVRRNWSVRVLFNDQDIVEQAIPSHTVTRDNSSFFQKAHDWIRRLAAPR
jgi:hypothetical protein